MAQIKISNLPSLSDESLLVNLTEYEQDMINGAGLWTLLKTVGKAVGDFVVDILD